MLFKNAVAQAFITVLLFTHLQGMEKSAAISKQNNWVSDTIPVILPNNPLQKPIRVHVQIIAPDNCITEEQRMQHFASRAQELKCSLNDALKAYLIETKKQSIKKNQNDIELLKIVPSGIYFEPDNRKLILQESFGTHQINPEIEAYLEARVLCTYDQAGNWKTNPYQLYVFQKTGGSKKPLAISMERLRRFCEPNLK